MKKLFFLLLIMVVIFVAYKTYIDKKTELREWLSTQETQQNNNLNINGKSYNRIKSEWPKGDILGNVLGVNENSITIEELISLKCFFVFDYISDENRNISKAEMDAQHNTEYLPWCSDPSAGTLYEKTGKNITHNFDSKTKFYLTVFSESTSSSNVTKNIFIQKVQEYKPNNMMVTLVLNGNTVIQANELYND